MDLRDYERAKFELAELLRSTATLSKNGSNECQDGSQELFARLAEDRFNLVVVGRFSRGKSSLMNAILGIERLPTGIRPLTSVITTVLYGSKEKVVIRYEGSRLSTEVPLEALAEYITQEHNPGNLRRVRTAEVQLPAEILRRGLHFIDTPGLGSAILENTRTTEQFLPEADALLLVTSYESPLSQDEIAILRSTSWYSRRVFVILNKQDTVSTAERDEALCYVREQLAGALGPRAPTVFSVSARDGLEAKLAHDPARLAASGVQAFETELIRYLLEEKREEFVMRFCERLLDLIRKLPQDADTDRLTSNVSDFAERMGQARPDFALPGMAEAVAVDVSGSLHELRPCEICEHIRRVSFDFLCRYQYDLNVSPEAQRRHADAGGFCAAHTKQYGKMASPRGICTGYSALLDRFASRLRGAALSASSSEMSEELKRLLPTAKTCPLCRVCAAAEAEAVASIVDRLKHERSGGVDALSAICTIHLCRLVSSVDDAGSIRGLLLRHAAILERLSEDMRRYATKHDAIRRQLASEEEINAAERTLWLVAGLPNAHIVDDAM